MSSVSSRQRILAWTSLWIYVPSIVWIIRFPSPVPFWYFILLPISGTLSLLHWLNNSNGDWRHIADVTVAVVLAISLSYRLVETKRNLECACFCGGMASFFIFQRIAQRVTNVHWGLVTLFHVLFRYFGFWLAMAVHLSEIRNYTLWSTLTILYIIHIACLYFIT